jgi:hypothetical protein
MTTLEKLEQKVADTTAAYEVTVNDIKHSAATSSDSHLIRVSRASFYRRNDLIQAQFVAQDKMLDAQSELKRFLKSQKIRSQDN